MAEFKLVIAQKDGKSVQKELKGQEADSFLGLKLGDNIRGDVLGFSGYEFQISGGSDKSGFPMRSDVSGTLRKRIFSTKSMGLRTTRAGEKQRKSFAGNTVFDGTAQVNVVILKQGSKPLVEAPSKAEAVEKDEEKKEEAVAQQI